MAETETTWVEESMERQKQRQMLFHTWKLFEEDMAGFMKTYIGCILFHQGQSENERTPVNFNEYREFFCESELVTIENLYSQIRTKIPVPNNVYLGCTFLTLYLGKDENNENYLLHEYPLFRCKSSLESNEIFFIESSGRLYTDWNDFVYSNKLPSCQYLTPINGCYEIDGEICKYESPEACKGFIARYADGGFIAATFGCAAAGFFSVAAIPVAIVSNALTLYGVGQAISDLKDRNQHSESLRPDSVQTISSYLMLGTAGLSILSNGALAARKLIVERFSKWGPTALRTLNISVLCLDVGSIAFNAYVFHEKMKAGEFTMKDTFSLVLQVYLIYGQVSNTIEIHEMLSNSNPVVSPPKLTKSQKRNLRRRRAKAAKRNELLGTGTVRIVESNTSLFDSLNGISHLLGLQSFKFLSNYLPRQQIVTEFLISVKESFWSWWHGRIDYISFFMHLRLHVRNLLDILQNDWENLTPLFTHFNVRFDWNVANMVYNGIQRVEENEVFMEDEIDQMIDNLAIENENTDAELTSEDTPIADNIDVIMKNIDISFILSKVKNIINRCTINGNFSSKLSIVVDVLNYFREVLNELIRKYEILFNVNSNLELGQELVDEILKVVGVKIGGQFFPNCKYFEKTLIDSTINADVITNAINYIDIVENSATSSADECLLNDCIVDKIAELFQLVVSAEAEIGLEVTTNMLVHVANFYVTEKVIEFETTKSSVDEIYRANANIVGDAEARQILARANLSPDNFDILKKCIETELRHTQVCQLLKSCKKIVHNDLGLGRLILEDPSAADNIMKNIDICFILNEVKNLIKRCEISGKFSLKLSIIVDTLIYFREVFYKLEEKYEELVANPNSGPEPLVTAVGTKIGQNFFPNSKVFEKILLNSTNNVREITNNIKYINNIKNCVNLPADECLLNDCILDKIAELFRLVVPGEAAIGLGKTMNILVHVAEFYVTEKVAIFETTKSMSEEVYRVNANLLGDTKARQILISMDLLIDDIDILKKSIEEELNDAKIEQLLESLDVLKLDQTDDAEETFTNKESYFKTILIRNTSRQFMKKIENFDDVAKDVLLKKVILFVTDKFARQTEELKSVCGNLRDNNSDIVDPAMFKAILENVKRYPFKTKYILEKTSESIIAFGDDIVFEYFQFFENSTVDFENIRMFETNATEEGLQWIEVKNCDIDWPDFEYKNLASSIFKIGIEENYTVQKYKTYVLLTDENIAIAFLFDEAAKKWVAILSKKSDCTFDDDKDDSDEI